MPLSRRPHLSSVRRLNPMRWRPCANWLHPVSWSTVDDTRCQLGWMDAAHHCFRLESYRSAARARSFVYTNNTRSLMIVIIVITKLVRLHSDASFIFSLASLESSFVCALAGKRCNTATSTQQNLGRHKQAGRARGQSALSCGVSFDATLFSLNRSLELRASNGALRV